MADSFVEQDDSDVIEIIPAEDYNSQRAKLKASISWVLTKAYGTKIPAQMKDPFYENAKGQLQVRPQLINLMTSSELYCQACANMFSDTASQWQGHWSIIQILSRKGIRVLEVGGTVITETVLMHTTPFKVAAHLALIDALMRAYASEIASVEKVIQAVRHHVTSRIPSPLPGSVEEALVLWINKTCTALAAREDCHALQETARKKLETISRTAPGNPKSTHPKIADLMNDLGDGSCVAATVSFYQPDSLPVTDVCLKGDMDIADSLYNLRLIESFCKSCLALKCFHFTYEDLLYGRENLHDNVLIFLAELFFLLEDLQSKTAAKDAVVEGSNRGVSVRRPSSPTGRQSFVVPKRGSHRSSGETTPQSEKMSTSPRTREGMASLLQNVSMSMDTDVTDSRSHLDNPVTSTDLSRYDTAASVSSLSRSPHTRQEQLLPAQLRLSKEKGPQQTKAEELGDHSHKHRMAEESKLMKGKVAVSKSSLQRRLGSSGGTGSGSGHSGALDGDETASQASDSGDSSSRRSDSSAGSHVSSQAAQHILPGSQPYSIPEASPRDSSRTVDSGGGGRHSEGSSYQASPPSFGRSTSDLSTDSCDWGVRHVRTSREGSIASSRSSGDFSDHESHKIHQDHKAKESLKQSPPQSSDPHRPQTQSATPGLSRSLPEEGPRQGSFRRSHPAQGGEDRRTISESQTTASRGGEESARSVSSAQEASGDSSSQANLKSSFLQRSDSGAKKATFAPLPTETTWQERAHRNAAHSGTRLDSAYNAESPPMSELSQLRLKLEEKRREIERKKQQQEVQSARMRQRLGKAAFMRVIAKKDESGNTVGISNGRPVISAWNGRGRTDVTNSSPVLSQASLQDRLGQLGLDEPVRPTSLLTSPQSSSNSTSASQSPSTAGRPFSRETIQQTIDGVRRRWFHGSDPEGELIYATDQTDDAEGMPVAQMSFDMMQSCPPSMASEMFGYSSSSEPAADQDRGRSVTPTESSAPSYSRHRESSQSPRRTPEKRVSWAESRKPKNYDDSFDKLNRSLTDLQGEINRLTLQQQEDMFAASSEGEEEPPAEMTMSDSHVAQHRTATSPSPHLEPRRPAQHRSQAPAVIQQTHISRTTDSFPQSPSPHTVPTSLPSGGQGDSLEEDTATEGFFVSFGGDTPRRPKPELGTTRDSSEGRRKDVRDAYRERPEAVLRLQGKMSSAGVADCDSGSSSSGSYHSLPGVSTEEGVSEVDSAARQKKILEVEMQKKRERLIQQQQKRQEDMERKRLQKEKQTQRKRQEKELKEEEVEKKKAEDKARRQAIFQQYIQKKLEQEEEKPSSPSVVSRRDHSTSSTNRRDHSINRRDHSSHRQPRPKSMFAKARPLPSDLEEPGSRGMSSHSSQEDLSSHSSPMGSTVSCDQLNQNGDQGPNPSRRPPSPGTKLYVKPSSKSNRHIIINALSYCCLAGIVNTDQKNKVLEEIAKSTAKHFVILFRDHGCQYRGLFSFDPDTEEACKIMGVGPRQFSSHTVERFYKYNSGGKSFNEVTSTKHLSVSIDAVVLKNTYWKSKVSSAAKR